MRSMKIWSRGTAALVLALVTAVGSHGQVPGGEGGVEVTLAEAIRLARQNNPAYRQVENDAAGAEWNVRNAYASFLPTANASSAATYQAEGRQRFGLFTSADIGAGTTTDYLFSTYSINVNYSLSPNNFARVSSARADRRATTARIAAAGFTLESAVTGQYLAALRARDNVRAAERAFERADQNFELVSARVRVGAVAATDGKQAEVDRGRAQVALLQAENLLRTEKLRLMEQIGRHVPDELRLTSEFDVFEPDWTADDLIERALVAHPSLRALAESEKARNADVWQARSAYLPTLNVFANWSGFARQIGNEDFLLGEARSTMTGRRENCEFFNSISSGLSAPLPGYPRDCSSFVLSPADERTILSANKVFPFDWDPDPFAVTLQVSVPIFQGFGRQLQLEQAHNLAEDAHQARRAEELRLRTAVTQALDGLRTNYDIVAIESRGLEVAGEQAELARERYRLGAANYLELLQAQESLATADRDYLNARYNFHNSVSALEAAVGARLLTDVGQPR